MNLNHFCHIIRDTFGLVQPVLDVGGNGALEAELRTSLFGYDAFTTQEAFVPICYEYVSLVLCFQDNLSEETLESFYQVLAPNAHALVLDTELNVGSFYVDQGLTTELRTAWHMLKDTRLLVLRK